MDTQLYLRPYDYIVFEERREIVDYFFFGYELMLSEMLCPNLVCA